MPLNASRYKAPSFRKHRIFTTKSFSVAYINSSLQIFIFLEDLGCLFQFWVIAVLVNLQVKIYSNEGRNHVTQNWKWSTIRSSKNEGFKRLLVVIFLLGKLFRGPDRSKRTLSSPCTKFVFQYTFNKTSKYSPSVMHLLYDQSTFICLVVGMTDLHITFK